MGLPAFRPERLALHRLIGIVQHVLGFMAQPVDFFDERSNPIGARGIPFHPDGTRSK